MTPLSRQALASLVASQLPAGGFVNLGIGAPTQVANFVRPEADVILHSENGLLNMGPAPAPAPAPAPGAEDLDLINAGKSPVTLLPGGAFFDSSLAFAMMRGGHLDVAVLGAFQVSGAGDLANWSTGGDDGEPPGIGGAIDLAVGAKAIWVMMDHVTREGAPRIVAECTLPLTAQGVVSRVFTSLAVIEITAAGLWACALLEGASLAVVQAVTGVPLSLAPDARRISAEGRLLAP
ncbi:3-oxoacid CoA-transferase subunit B [Dankookia rubra]|uniref:3-oxoacid CoA-transferase subunit B n=1 Tax=Dankookia rubra TaxID=1442381 RepID=A0A4V3A9I4_9PROT|nr:3-oxoacid CoA-transferase subunit B [Dankookia rubra]TDH59355.1 3-oxoacid CoA-transferase subunit B [Dankookia rubra]